MGSVSYPCFASSFASSVSFPDCSLVAHHPCSSGVLLLPLVSLFFLFTGSPSSVPAGCHHLVVDLLVFVFDLLLVLLVVILVTCFVFLLSGIYSSLLVVHLRVLLLAFFFFSDRFSSGSSCFLFVIFFRLIILISSSYSTSYSSSASSSMLPTFLGFFSGCCPLHGSGLTV